MKKGKTAKSTSSVEKNAIDFDTSFIRSKSSYHALTNSFASPQGEHHPETHPFAQLIHVKKGVAQVITQSGIWVIPPSKAVWIPSLQVHDAQFFGDVTFNHLFFKNEVTQALPENKCYLIDTSPLLQEIFGYLALVNFDRDLKPSDQKLFEVVLDHLKFKNEETPLWLPYPKDGRLKKLCELMNSELGFKSNLNGLAKKAGVSLRNAQRLFKKETNINLSTWLGFQKALRAVELLSRGYTVTETALELGFQSTGAFSTRFKELMGQTPKQYLSSLNG